MRLVVQRVKGASVLVKNTKKVVGRIDKGLLVLVGVKRGDTVKQAESLAEKLTKLRVMADENGKMNLTSQSFLVVSQFTLHAETTGGNRPSFINAEEPKKAKERYEDFIRKLKGKEVKVETGSFGDEMEIEAVLAGPVTILLES